MNDLDAQTSEQQTGSNSGWSVLARLRNAWDIEFSNLRVRVMFCTLLMRLLPKGRAVRMRTALVRAMGLQVGRGTRFLGAPKIQSNSPGPLGSRLKIGVNCTIGADVILEFGDVLTIGDRVSLADAVVILTTTHELGPKERRAGTLVRHPVVIGDDVAIGASSIILPGAKIGAGACVMPNSVVNSVVAPGITVSGIPARPVRSSG